MSMTTNIPQLTRLAAWQALETHYPKVREFIPELETGAKYQLKHDSSTNTLIRRYRRSKELLHGR